MSATLGCSWVISATMLVVDNARIILGNLFTSGPTQLVQSKNSLVFSDGTAREAIFRPFISNVFSNLGISSTTIRNTKLDVKY